MRWYSAAVVNRRRGSFVLLKEGLQFVDFAPKGIDHSLRADINSIAGVPLMHRNRGTLAPGDVELNAEPVHIEVFRIEAVCKSVPTRGVKSRGKELPVSGGQEFGEDFLAAALIVAAYCGQHLATAADEQEDGVV
jgi:hypothetical protein